MARNKKQLKQEIVQDWIEDYKALYEELKGMGKSDSEARDICNRLKEQEESHNTVTADGAHTSYRDKRYQIRLQYGLEDILRVLPEFKEMSKKEQEEVLFNAGYDTKNYRFYYEDLMYTNILGKRVYGTVIVGSERIDEEYLNTRVNGQLVASEAAQWYSRRDLISVMKENSKRG